MSFFEDKALISGSVDGRVNLSDLENLDKKKGAYVRFQKMQNVMDRKIPISRCETSTDFGIGMAIDIEGNCRFYDLIRFKKMAKISSSQMKSDDARLGSAKFGMMMNQSLSMSADAFLSITQWNKTFFEES